MFPRLGALLILFATASAGRGNAESYFAEKSHDFGPTPRGPKLLHLFKFTNNTKDPVAVSRVRASCTCLTATVPSQKIKPGESGFVTVYMDTRRFSGPKTETIYVQFSEPRVEEVALKIQANAREELTMSPDQIAFGTIRPGSTASASVQITLAGDPKWVISEVKPESDIVKVSAKLLTQKANEVTYEISATLRSDLAAGKWQSEILLKTSNKDVSSIRIPVSVEIMAPGSPK